MSYYVIENFANGVDVRRSQEVAPAGSLRVLSNAFINEGGEIQKRQAFSLEATLTDYAQSTYYKGRITGPHTVPGYPDSAFFRHRHDSLPGGSWSSGAGSVAESYSVGSGYSAMTFWAMKSTIALSNFGALMAAANYSEFSSTGYVVEQHVQSSDYEYTQDHVSVAFTGGEPTAESLVSANNDRDYQMTLDGKGYVIEGNTLYASAVDDATDMAGTGSGSLLMTSKGRPIGNAMSLGDYYGQLAVFGRRGVQFYTVDPDFSLTQYQRTVPISLFAPRSVTGFGDGDVIFMGYDGLRSLQARDSSNLAAVSDIGSPIDRLIKAEIEYGDADQEPLFSSAAADRSNADYYNLAKGVVHPQNGQFWLFLKDKVFVLSRHPAARVLAWSSYDLPTPAVANYSDRNGRLKGRWCADVCTVGQTIVFRNFADEVYIYGGSDGGAYDGATAEAITPFMDMGQPGHNKSFTGIDVVCEGEWSIEASVNPSPDDVATAWAPVATVNNSTRGQYRVPMDMQGTQIALRLTSASEYAARVGQIVIYYDGGAEK